MVPELPQWRVCDGWVRCPRPFTVTDAPGRSGEMVAPSRRNVDAVERASSEASGESITDLPSATAANINARCVMLLSPGTR